MDCESIRAAISASLDGEEAGVPADLTRAHLDDCAACRDWRERQHTLTRRARLSGYALDHDLTARVLSALPAAAPRSSRMPAARRAALAVVAVAGALLLCWQSRALSSRTLPADADTVTAAPRAADATTWSGDGQRAGKKGRPVARRNDVA